VPLPDPPLGLLIVAARHSIRQAIYARARRHRLTVQQFWALHALRQEPGLTQGELGQRVHLDAPAASRLVAELAKRKLIDVRPDRDDRRRLRLYLGERGLPLAEKLQAIADEYGQAVTRGIPEPELSALRAGLRKVIDNLAAFAAAGDEGAAPPARSDRVARAG
jgi:DNA-binding MarR family transcriptional regulator